MSPIRSLTTDRLDAILTRAAAVRVAVIGDLMLDVYLTGSVSRISPEAPVPVVQVNGERSALGGAANVAANVIGLGAGCDVLGVVGQDEGGRQIRASLAALGVGKVTPLILDLSDRPTTTKTRVMARQQQVVRFDRERDDDLPDDVARALISSIRDSARAADAIILEDYNKGVLSPAVIHAALEVARERQIPVVVDPKFRHIFEYRGATVFKPNALELTSALGVPIRPDDDIWLEAARARFECEHLLVTLGDAGMVLASHASAPLRIPTVARKVYDVSGAGDTVSACLAVALAAGASIAEAAVLANVAAGIEVGKPGVATVSPDELRDEVASLRSRTHPGP